MEGIEFEGLVAIKSIISLYMYMLSLLRKALIL